MGQFDRELVISVFPQTATLGRIWSDLFLYTGPGVGRGTGCPVKTPMGLGKQQEFRSGEGGRWNLPGGQVTELLQGRVGHRQEPAQKSFIALEEALNGQWY